MEVVLNNVLLELKKMITIALVEPVLMLIVLLVIKVHVSSVNLDLKQLTIHQQQLMYNVDVNLDQDYSMVFALHKLQLDITLILEVDKYYPVTKLVLLVMERIVIIVLHALLAYISIP
jgi:hypothetical protein